VGGGGGGGGGGGSWWGGGWGGGGGGRGGVGKKRHPLGNSTRVGDPGHRMALQGKKEEVFDSFLEGRKGRKGVTGSFWGKTRQKPEGKRTHQRKKRDICSDLPQRGASFHKEGGAMTQGRKGGGKIKSCHSIPGGEHGGED